MRNVTRVINKLIKLGVKEKDFNDLLGFKKSEISKVVSIKFKPLKEWQVGYRYPNGYVVPPPERGLIQTRGYKLRKPIRKLILKRDNYICHYCSKGLVGTDSTVDHKVPMSKGGTHDHSNLVASCRRCNSRKMLIDYNKFKEIIKNEEIKISAIPRNGLI
jgi:hypothetical protein